ncbi:MAG: NAD synthetase [Phycisphaera sp.]|nr:NAD synthetase [Phycisphaera sp.]
MPILAFTLNDFIGLAYLVASVLFILGLKMMSQVATARRGNFISSAGMALAGVVTLLYIGDNQLISLTWVFAALLIGTAIGLLLALKTPMTGMPQMVALLNGFGGMASLLVACGDYVNSVSRHSHLNPLVLQVMTRPWSELLAVGLTVLVGGVTFTGSMIAFGKLQGLKITPSKPIQFPGQKATIAALLVLCLILSCVMIPTPMSGQWMVPTIAVAALLLGVLLVIGIGGADMPVVICLLNSYSGIAGAFAGFVLNNMALIITGSLVGASGLILTNIMCKAMNRSLANVLFGGVGANEGQASSGSDGAPQGNARQFLVEDVTYLLGNASQVMVVPGYGMAVAQAQHAVADMGKLLEERGIKVRYAIHPVAGRMPGHMNVLLAEANVPYDVLLDLDGSNAEFEQTDVALIIGANDVTNPAARHAKSSPIYGMPILDCDKAKQVVVIKRSLNPGFAGVENELYFRDNCGMLFGDAKKMVTELISRLKQEG